VSGQTVGEPAARQAASSAWEAGSTLIACVTDWLFIFD
jgi:hypothetical protein